MGALLLRQSGTNFDGRNIKRRNNKDMVDDLLSEFEPSIRSARVEGVFRAVDRGLYYDKQEGDQADPYGKSPWNPPYSNLHLSSSQIYATVVEALDLQPGMSFLNLGSGSGYLSTLVGLLIGPNGLNHGIELHKDVVDYAYKKLEQFKLTSSAIDKYDLAEPIFISGNFLNFNPSHRYDRVYLGAECLPDALRFVMQLVKPGGGILVMPYEENLMRHVRLGESKWHSQSLMSVIFTTMIGLGPLVGHDGELREERMIEIPPNTTKSLKELCRIVIRQQLRFKTERVNPELPNSDNLDRRRELRKLEKRRRQKLKDAQLRRLQSECMRCRRESWRSTAGLKGEPTSQEGEPDESTSPESIRRRLLSRLRNMETDGEDSARTVGTNRNHFLNWPRPTSNNSNRQNLGVLPMDYADDDEEDWSFSLRSYPRRLFKRPLGGASSARPFRDITFEDILSGRPPLSDLMRYRPASPRPRQPRARRQVVEMEHDQGEEMMDFEQQLESPPSSCLDDSSSSSSSSSSEEDDDHNAMRSESSSNSAWDSDSDSDLENESDNIIIVDSSDDDDDGADAERQVSERETRLSRIWSDFFRGLEPASSHWLASSEDDDQEQEPSLPCQMGRRAPRCRRWGLDPPSEQQDRLTSARESPSISCRLRSRARKPPSSHLVTGDTSDEQQAGGSINSTTTTTTHDKFTSGGPFTRSAARAMPYQRRAQVVTFEAAASNCSPSVSTSCSPQTLTSMSDDAHRPSSSSERKRKRQSSSSSSSSEELDEHRDKSSSSQSSFDDAATRRRSRCARTSSASHGGSGHSTSSSSSSLLGYPALTGDGVAGGTSVAIDSRGVMSTMTTRVIMPCATGHQDGAAPFRSSRPRTAANRFSSCGLPATFLPPFVDGDVANNNDNNEQVPQTPAAAATAAASRPRPRASEACESRRAESDHSQTGNAHRHRDCKHHRDSPGACSRHLRGLQVERQRRARRHQHESLRPYGPITTRYRPVLYASAGSSGQSGDRGPLKPSECEKYRSHMSASIKGLAVPNVLRDYLNHERDF